MISSLSDFNGKIAVVTGGGTGMGRELVRQLIADGCSVATCDVNQASLDRTTALCNEAGMPQGTRLFTHIADVSIEEELASFRTALTAALETDHIDLLFNNAGIGGGNSFVSGSRADWERTFNINWFGVYYSCRVFLPLLKKSQRAHIVNTSSMNGMWASLGPFMPQTGYSASKFAVRGFTEGLITDLRLHAPHITCSVVFPGHIGTNIARNTLRVLGGETPSDEAGRAALFERAAGVGLDRATIEQIDLDAFLDKSQEDIDPPAVTSAADAARIMIDGVKNNQWRILVGPDTYKLDEAVRSDPDHIYDENWDSTFINALPKE